MTIFEDLRQAFAAWDDAGEAYEREVYAFFEQFVQGFHTYLGAPAAYPNFPNSNLVGYVHIVVQQEGADGTVNYGGAVIPGNYLVRGEDGYFNGYINFTLDRQSNQFPKFAVVYHVHFSLTPEECMLDFGDQNTLRLKRIGEAPNLPAYERMVDLLRRMFQRDPWDNSALKQPIGFALQKNDA